MTRAERAVENFAKGYNCAQAVVLAFADLLGEEKDLLLRTVSAFGGGFSRAREVCGAVSGMAYVVGRTQGYSDPKDPAEKQRVYGVMQKLIQKFRAEHGTIVCKELLKGCKVVDGDRSGRPCPKMIETAARLLSEVLFPDGEASAKD